ncbi:methionyl-tRNA formyltransferase [Herbivorax sp. ANBcel31]|uniref:methionyl-tRNA formyltransferase n=1 Tax=Herbivorax sp. ANBcel31 TaxID=3069754 RepID=UPI0027B0F626|nr:methionyl-tRNA formyltransferase [Herbivorax sp. ANBcel31]MDQ2087151.1 methionyl-tRNA formyltransferase [Herbivorax sp. ANBcel31]
MRVVFMGTPDFALPSLDMLVQEGYDIAAVVTQPDKPAKRGKKVTMPPVKDYAISKGIRVLQPEKIKTSEFLETLEEIKPDILITVAYGKILSKEILDLPPHGCINVHGSLLPKYRGAAPVHWSIINGEKTTGITTMYTNEGMDTGDMLLKSEISISENMIVGELHDELSVLGAQVLKETLQKLNELERIPQDKSEATYAPIIKKEIGEINWSKSSNEVHNLIRGTNPWPGAFTYYTGSKMKVWKTEVVSEELHNCKPGTILKVNKEGILVCCGKGKINIKEVQFASCRRMCVGDYICGNKIDEGEILG